MKTDYSDGIEGMRRFAERFEPSPAAVDWAEANCKSMAEVWDKAQPDWLICIATREGVLDDRTLRLFACWCVRKVWHLLTDERSRRAVECAERHADGLASDSELAEAWDAASVAAWASRTDLAPASWLARDAAWSAARAAADVAVRTSSAAASRVAADAAVRTSSVAASWADHEASWDAQAAYLRKLGNPFRGEA